MEACVYTLGNERGKERIIILYITFGLRRWEWGVDIDRKNI